MAEMVPPRALLPAYSKCYPDIASQGKVRAKNSEFQLEGVEVTVVSSLYKCMPPLLRELRYGTDTRAALRKIVPAHRQEWGGNLTSNPGLK